MVLECDVLIPAALGGMIRADNAHLIRARAVIEGANSPTTPRADEILAVAARAEHDEVGLPVAAFEAGIERVVEAATTRGYI